MTASAQESLVKQDVPLGLYLMLGYGGSGKSYFARQFAAHTGAVRLNGDATRLALFQSRERMKTFGPTEVTEGILDGAMNYATEQILLAEVSVVYDMTVNKRHTRKNLGELAARHGALTTVVWVRTPREIAIQRGQDREDLPDQRRLDKAAIIDVIEGHIYNMEEPEAHERVVELDGLLPFADQLTSFTAQMKDLAL